MQAQLLESLRAKSPEALAQAYQLYGPMVYNACLRLLGQAQAAEDATQAVFLLLFEKAPKLNSGTRLAGWLHLTAAFVSREARRSEARRRRREEEAAAMAHENAALDPHSEAAWHEMRPRVDQALAQLPERYRVPLTAVYLLGQSQQHIAQELKVPEGTLRWRLSHGLQLLRKRLGADERLPAATLLLCLASHATEAPLPPALLSKLSAAAQALVAHNHSAVSASVAEYCKLGRRAMFYQKARKVGALSGAVLLAVLCLVMIGPQEPVLSSEASKPTQKASAARSSAAVPNQTVAESPQFEGALIKGIELSGVAPQKAARLLAGLATKNGQAFSRQQWEQDVAELEKAGTFAAAVPLPPTLVEGGVKLTLRLIEKNAVVSEFCSGPPEMVFEQTAQAQGGRMVLYSRNRFGNYPLASYALHLGLRGDDKRVRNDVNLLFGNASRKPTFKGRSVDEVTPGHGAAGMDGGAPEDRLQVACCGANRNKIVDLGEVDYATLKVPPKGFARAEDRAYVKQGHVYVVRVWDKNVAALAKPLLFKVKVIEHRDNDAVLLEWEPLQVDAKAALSEDF